MELKSSKTKMPPEVTSITKPDRAERLGWLTESSVQPRKRRAIEGARQCLPCTRALQNCKRPPASCTLANSLAQTLTS